MDTAKICDIVEGIMQLEVDHKLKDGSLKFVETTSLECLEEYKKLILEHSNAEDLLKIGELFDAYMDSPPKTLLDVVLRGLIPPKHWPDPVDFLRDLTRLHLTFGRGLAYFDREISNFFVLKDNLEEAAEGIRMTCLFEGIPYVSEEDMLETVVAHEIAHKTHADHYPGLFERRDRFLRLLEGTERGVEQGISTPEKAQPTIKVMKDTVFTINAYMEGVATYVEQEFEKRAGKKVLSAMEGGGDADDDFERMVLEKLGLLDDIEAYEKGVRLIRFVEENTSQNPLTFTYGREPAARLEIERPWEYLIRVLHSCFLPFDS